MEITRRKLITITLIDYAIWFAIGFVVAKLV